MDLAERRGFQMMDVVASGLRELPATAALNREAGHRGVFGPVHSRPATPCIAEGGSTLQQRQRQRHCGERRTLDFSGCRRRSAGTSGWASLACARVRRKAPTAEALPSRTMGVLQGVGQEKPEPRPGNLQEAHRASGERRTATRARLARVSSFPASPGERMCARPCPRQRSRGSH